MIISNLWLQTDYGVKFANYLLDHFKICAIIDIPLRIFQALITTTIILLEKEKDKNERENNDVVFVRLPPDPVEDIKADEILRAIKESMIGLQFTFTSRKNYRGKRSGFVTSLELQRSKKAIQWLN